ncbi:MAG: protein phosphatase 2C domain-containing protein [Planctomycetaceae bacterium]|nr:protein phosphatase 2C domain-containing protein [Planctomycetaceae bacterium]
MRGEFVRGIGYTRAGGDHAKVEDGCEDAVFVSKQNRRIGVALCDGASTAHNSQAGARTTAESVSKLLANCFDSIYSLNQEDISSLILEHALSELDAVRNKKQCDLRSFACTLLFVACKPLKNTIRFIAGNLGDGVVLMSISGRVDVLFPADNGKYANQTYFVTSKDARSKLRVYKSEVKCSQLPGWFLSTDGASELLFDHQRGQSAPVVSALLEDLRVFSERKVQKTLCDLVDRIILPRSFDDCGVAILQSVSRSSKIPRRRM